MPVDLTKARIVASNVAREITDPENAELAAHAIEWNHLWPEALADVVVPFLASGADAVIHAVCQALEVC